MVRHAAITGRCVVKGADVSARMTEYSNFEAAANESMTCNLMYRHLLEEAREMASALRDAKFFPPKPIPPNALDIAANILEHDYEPEID